MSNKPEFDAHSKSFRNRICIEKSKIVGCFYCLRTYPATEIYEYCQDDDNETGFCPYCGIDSVLGDKAGYPLTKEFLQKMRSLWFET